MLQPAQVVWVTEEQPSQHLGGGSVRQAHLLAAVARRAPTSLILGASPVDPDIRALVSVTEVPVPPHRTPSTTRRRIDELLRAAGAGSREEYWHRGTRRAMRAEVARQAASARLVVLQHQSMLPLLTRRGPAVWAADIHHVSSEMARQELELVTGRRQRWSVAREVTQARALERWAVERFDIVSLCSDDDARLLASPPEKTIVTPNGVDTERYRPAPLPKDPTVLLPATLNYLPNVEGASWFCAEVWGRVRAAVPDATLRLVGRAPVPEVRALAAIEGVSVHGDVESMVPWLHDARVVVVPVRIGTGTRLKVVEAFAAGRPVIGTTVGFGGLDVADRRDVRVADDPHAMAAAVVELLTDDDDAGRLAAAGRKLVVERYSWDRLAATFADRILEMAGVAAAAQEDG